MQTEMRNLPALNIMFMTHVLLTRYIACLMYKCTYIHMQNDNNIFSASSFFFLLLYLCNFAPWSLIKLCCINGICNELYLNLWMENENEKKIQKKTQNIKKINEKTYAMNVLYMSMNMEIRFEQICLHGNRCSMRFADMSIVGCLGMDMKKLIGIGYSLKLQLWELSLISSKNLLEYWIYVN